MNFKIYNYSSLKIIDEILNIFSESSKSFLKLLVLFKQLCYISILNNNEFWFLGLFQANIILLLWTVNI